MSTVSEQVIADFAAGLERARSRCAELQSAITDARGKLDELKVDAERETAALHQQIVDAVSHAREALAHATQEAASSADLARQLTERLAQTAGEMQTAADESTHALEAFGQAAQDGSAELAAAADTLIANAEHIGAEASQAYQSAAAGFTETLGDASTASIQTLDSLATDADSAFNESRTRTQSALDRDGIEKSQSTREGLEGLVSELGGDVSGWIDNFRDDGDAQISAHREGWTGKFAELASSARTFTNDAAAVGEDVLGIARAMTEGADTVTDAMDVTNVGLRTVVGIFDNMQAIMDDVISFA